MSILSNLKSKFSGGVKKFSGRKDFLEAVCAACALIAAADGDVSDAEVAKTVKAISSNANLSAGFQAREIETVADAMLKRAQGGRVGRAGLKKEIEDIANDQEMGAVVLYAALDVADEGGIDDAERKVLNDIASILHLNLKDYE